VKVASKVIIGALNTRMLVRPTFVIATMGCQPPRVTTMGWQAAQPTVLKFVQVATQVGHSLTTFARPTCVSVQMEFKLLVQAALLTTLLFVQVATQDGVSLSIRARKTAVLVQMVGQHLEQLVLKTMLKSVAPVTLASR
jgi:hypothetical protein